MKAISLFSGVGGFELGFDRAGIETVLQAEQDPWCLKVLERHWPEAERITDVRNVGSGAPSANLIYGGFPCQDLSVAGKRVGLGGERSGLWFEFYRVLSELWPRWAVIENVPGLLSSNKGRDFGVILEGLVELGYSVGWAVLDAQNFGVPQRRRRVYVVAGPRTDAVAQVLSLCESCGGDPQAGGAARQGAARGAEAGTGTAGGTVAVRTAQTSSNGWGINEEGTAYTLDGAQGQAVLAKSLGNNPRRGADYDTYISIGALDTNLGTKRWLENQSWELWGDGAGGRGVRRLTPLECERLQGWPDDHTRWAADGSEIADSHRYRMCGNGVVSTVAEWIGRRLVWVDEHL